MFITIPVLKKGDDPNRATIFGVDQPDYIPLPGLRGNPPQCMVTSRWHLTLKDRFKLIIYGDLWVQMMTFGHPLMPIKLLLDEPAEADCGIGK